VAPCGAATSFGAGLGLRALKCSETNGLWLDVDGVKDGTADAFGLALGLSTELPFLGNLTGGLVGQRGGLLYSFQSNKLLPFLTLLSANF
jgi:hypothetical protein